MFKVENLIYIYIALCGCMMVFNIIYMMFMTTSEKNVKYSKAVIMKKINSQLLQIENGASVKIMHKKYLYQKLKKIHNLLLFEYTLDLNDNKNVKKYIENIQTIFDKLSIYYKKADGVKKAYFAYILEKYDIIANTKSKILINSMYDFLEENSIYCRDNSFKAIINSNDIDVIIEALKILNKIDYYHYPNIICKALLRFKGNPKDLENKLWKEFDEFNTKVRIAIIRYANEAKLDYREEFYEALFKESLEEEVKIEIVRYFGTNYYEPVQELLIEFTELNEVKNHNMILSAAKALKIYNSPETKDALKILMRKNDWKIKEVVSESLSAMITDYYELVDIYNEEDETTRKILRYKMQNQKLRYEKKELEVK